MTIIKIITEAKVIPSPGMEVMNTGSGLMKNQIVTSGQSSPPHRIAEIVRFLSKKISSETVPNRIEGARTSEIAATIVLFLALSVNGISDSMDTLVKR